MRRCLTTRYSEDQKEQEEQLIENIKQNTYGSSKEVVDFVKETFNVEYKPKCMVDTLKRLGFVYKKTTKIPGKPDREEQEAFIEKHRQLKAEKSAGDKILFMDGVHPQHNSKLAYCWIEKGKKKELKSNTGRKRINLNGALDAEGYDIVIREDESINAQSTIKLLQAIESRYDKANNIYIIADNARYYRAKLVTEYLKKSRIKIEFLPSYSPNLNLIERLWKFFYKKTLYNKYYETYEEFKDKCLGFFEAIGKYKGELRTLLTDNFQLFNIQISKT